MNQQILIEIIKSILTAVPSRPFLCLPMSASLYAILKDNYKIEPKLATGDLLYNGNLIFKQDFSISNAKDNTYQEWAGHSWVELGDLICDLSFFRTLYSDQFIRPYKKHLIDHFGNGRGCLIATSEQLNSQGLTYKAVEYLSDDMATGIIKGFEPLLKA